MVLVNNSKVLTCNLDSQVSYSKSLTDWAKTEVLKDLVKAKVREKYGSKLEKIADNLVEIMFENESFSKDNILGELY